MIPGGRGPAKLRQNQGILEFTREIDSARKPLAAICHGPQVLAAADLLKGRTATSFFTVSPEVKHAGARYVNRPVVIDVNLITSRMLKDIPACIDALFTTLVTDELILHRHPAWNKSLTLFRSCMNPSPASRV